MRYFKLIFVLALTTQLLSACFPLVAGAFLGGAIVAADRRSVGTQADDQAIELKLSDAFAKQLGNKVDIYTVSYNRNVLLTGAVANAKLIKEAEKIAASNNNVHKVVNALFVSEQIPAPTKGTDTLITTKVKTALITDKNYQLDFIKVITTQTVVYLMGIVTEKEAKIATQIAASVSGVSKVVSVFEFVTPEQLPQNPSPTPKSSPSY